MVTNRHNPEIAKFAVPANHNRGRTANCFYSKRSSYFASLYSHLVVTALSPAFGRREGLGLMRQSTEVSDITI